MNTRTLFRILPLITALVATVPIGWTVQVQAQGAAQGAQPTGPTFDMQLVEGKVAALDPAGKTLTLEDGTELTVPVGAQLPPDVTEGAIIRASFEVQAGQKTLTGLEVQKP